MRNGRGAKRPAGIAGSGTEAADRCRRSARGGSLRGGAGDGAAQESTLGVGGSSRGGSGGASGSISVCQRLVGRAGWNTIVSGARCRAGELPRGGWKTTTRLGRRLGATYHRGTLCQVTSRRCREPREAGGPLRSSGASRATCKASEASSVWRPGWCSQASRNRSTLQEAGEASAGADIKRSLPLYSPRCQPPFPGRGNGPVSAAGHPTVETQRGIALGSGACALQRADEGR